MSDRVFVARIEHSEQIYPFGEAISVIVSTEQTGGLFCLLRQTLVSGEWSAIHLHERESHFVQILSGVLEFENQGEIYQCAAGEWIFLPANQWHRFRVHGAIAVEMLVFNFPGGLDNMYREIVGGSSCAPDGMHVPEILARYGLRERFSNEF
jgi:quercetin dioxygenase-like cupin family protein